MDTTDLIKVSEYEWQIPKTGSMRVPGVIYADETLLKEMDEKVRFQIGNVASLPGIVKASYAMPDAHWGYGFPIGGVAAFDPHNGVVSAGGVGFDISCGVRTLLTEIHRDEFLPHKEKIADALFRVIPAGVGSHGKIRLTPEELDRVLEGGAEWAVKMGFGRKEDLERIESYGRAKNADPSAVSSHAKERQKNEMGTLGSGNHYLEVQEIREIYDEKIAAAFGLRLHELVVSIHCGSRGLGHQVATDYSKIMLKAAETYGIFLPDRELACAPLSSPEGKSYLGAMRAAINCALANREILSHLTREVFLDFFPKASLPLLYDVSHNTCLEEKHSVDGEMKHLFIHRKGATRAFGPGHPDLPESLRAFGQPVLIGGTMGTSSYILAGSAETERRAFSSACHGAGRQMSRTQATKQFQGRPLAHSLEERGISIRCGSFRGLAEEAPEAYKDVSAVVQATHNAGLAIRVAKLVPLACVKG